MSLMINRFALLIDLRDTTLLPTLSRCPEGCKLEVSRGIVQAVKNFQGRFLELDKVTGMYVEIEEKKAIKKTSQALREGQSKIKRLLLGKIEEDPMPHTPEYYFAYSVKVLSELYAADTNPVQLPPLPTLQKPRSEQDHVPPVTPVTKNTTNDAFNNAVQNALDQFPMNSQIINRNDEGEQFCNFMSKPRQLPRAITDSGSQYSVMSRASLSTISDIHTISCSDVSMSMASLFIDEATKFFDSTTDMSFMSPPEEGAAKESACLFHSPMNLSVGDFSIESDTMDHMESYASLFEEDDGKQSTCSVDHLLGSFASLFGEADKQSTCSMDHLIGSFASLFEVARRQSTCSTHSSLNQSGGLLSEF
jgi:hypothetical protein